MNVCLENAGFRTTGMPGMATESKPPLIPEPDRPMHTGEPCAGKPQI